MKMSTIARLLDEAEDGNFKVEFNSLCTKSMELDKERRDKCVKLIKSKLKIKNFLGSVESNMKQIWPIIIELLQEESPKF